MILVIGILSACMRHCMCRYSTLIDIIELRSIKMYVH